MTVAQLIEQLKTLPQNLPVVRGDADWGFVKLTDGAKVVNVEDDGATRGWTVDPSDWHDPEVNYYSAVKL
jgi:hypothetical protein